MTALYDEVLMFCRDALERQGYVLLDTLIEHDEWAAVQDQIRPGAHRRDLQKHFRSRANRGAPAALLRTPLAHWTLPGPARGLRRWLTGPYLDRPVVSAAIMQSIGWGHGHQTAGYAVVVLRNG
jgi:hypothetical protein